MKIEYWPHRGTFEESKKEKKSFISLQDALDYVVKNSEVATGFKPFAIEDIYITHYCYDVRLQNECFMLCVGKYGPEDYIKQYGHPVCHGYLYFQGFLTTEDRTPAVQSNGNLLNRIISASKLSLLNRNVSPQTLKCYLVENCDISQDNIEIFDEYCHFINIKEEKL